MKKSQLSFLVFAFLISLSASAWAADLRVEVKNLRSSDGNVHFAIYTDPENFPRDAGMLKDIILPVKNNSVEAVFTNLAPGDYALAIYHDENGDAKFDRGFFGIPVEGYGFSNDAKVFFGPPDFEDALVKVGEGNAKTSITMNYMMD